MQRLRVWPPERHDTVTFILASPLPASARRRRSRCVGRPVHTPTPSFPAGDGLRLIVSSEPIAPSGVDSSHTRKRGRLGAGVRPSITVAAWEPLFPKTYGEEESDMVQGRRTSAVRVIADTFDVYDEHVRKARLHMLKADELRKDIVYALDTWDDPANSAARIRASADIDRLLSTAD